jgi:hypothetical protein
VSIRLGASLASVSISPHSDEPKERRVELQRAILLTDAADW